MNLKRGCLSLLFLIGTTAMRSMGASASGTIAEGVCGDSVTWMLETDGDLYISGTGKMYDYTDSNAPWNEEYRDLVRTAVIEEGVENIGAMAFDFCENLVSVSLSQSVTSIGEFAFEGCCSLSVIDVSPENPAFCISSGVLYSRDLTELVYYPAGIQASSYRIAETTAAVDDFAFDSCCYLQEIQVPAGVRYVGMMQGCFNLERIVVDAGNLYYISQDGVLYDRDIMSIETYPLGRNADTYRIADGTQYVQTLAFFGCSSLREVVIPTGTAGIGDFAFMAADIRKITIPASVTEFGTDVFYGCENLTLFVEPGSAAERYAAENGIPYQYTAAQGSTYTGLVHFGGDVWQYWKNGAFDRSYTGLAEYNGGLYYIKEGILDWSYTDLVQYNGTWYCVQNGSVNRNYTGLASHNGGWYYVEKGTINWNYTGLTQYYGTWYHVEKGFLNWNYTSLTKYNGTWYYVRNGRVNWNYTGLVPYNGGWYYVEKGMVNWNYTGLTLYYHVWYYVRGGSLDWTYNGLVLHDGNWYYVQWGSLRWGYEGLVFHNGGWYYLRDSTVRWDYSGAVPYYGVLYYVDHGFLDWTYCGVTEYQGKTYQITYGVLSEMPEETTQAETSGEETMEAETSGKETTETETSGEEITGTETSAEEAAEASEEESAA